MDKCPYCGAALTTSLKFCVTCRRSVTEDRIRQMGYNANNEAHEIGRGSFKLVKKGYEGYRAIRTFFFGLSTILMLLLVYFCSMKFVVRKPIPMEKDLAKFIQSFQK